MSRWIDAGRACLEASRAREPGPGIIGVVGDALFACALERHERAAAEPWIQRALDDAEAHGSDVSLHRGLAGLGLLIAMYRPDEAELLADLDALVTAHLDQLPSASLQSGAAGIALYASVRARTESGAELGRAVVERLRASAVARHGGLVWHTPAAYAEGRRMSVQGEPILEYGIVHGVAGTLVGLAALASSGDEAARELARAGLTAAWAHAREGANRFGRVLFGEDGSLGVTEYHTPRWCVGDPGVLRALWLAARVVGDAASAERALLALRDEAARDARAPDRLAGRLDLCCGAAAVAQVHRRMHLETRDALFRDAAGALLARCAEGYARVEDVSFAYGRKGVLLALIAADDGDTDPGWDAILGMSLPRSR
jgi:hypothetical protein